MKECKICGKDATSGYVVHVECFNKITVTKKLDNGEQKTTYKAELRSEYLSFESVSKFHKSIETINRMRNRKLL